MNVLQTDSRGIQSGEEGLPLHRLGNLSHRLETLHGRLSLEGTTIGQTSTGSADFCTSLLEVFPPRVTPIRYCVQSIIFIDMQL